MSAKNVKGSAIPDLPVPKSVKLLRRMAELVSGLLSVAVVALVVLGLADTSHAPLPSKDGCKHFFCPNREDGPDNGSPQ